MKQADTELFTYLMKVQSVDVNLDTYSRLTALDIADMLGRRDMVRQLMSVAGQHSDNYLPDSASDSDEVSSAWNYLKIFIRHQWWQQNKIQKNERIAIFSLLQIQQFN